MRRPLMAWSFQPHQTNIVSYCLVTEFNLNTRSKKFIKRGTVITVFIQNK